jgi:hypothetical protein
MIELNASLIAQAVVIALILGVGGVLWRSVLALTKLTVLFDAHTKSDDKNFKEVKRDLRALRRPKGAKR